MLANWISMQTATARVAMGVSLCLLTGCDQRVEIPYTDANNAPTIEVAINGIAVRALIDSGAVCHCTISEELASQLRLQRLNDVEVITQGTSGELSHGWIASGSINLVIRNITMTVDRPYVAANKNPGAFPPVTIGYAGMKSMHLIFDYDHKTLVIAQ